MSYVVNSIIAVFKRVLRARIMPAIGLCVLLQSAVVADDRLQWTLGADGGWVITDTPLKSWVEGGWGKLRYDENTDGLNLYR
jgi:hypothetical protein